MFVYRISGRVTWGKHSLESVSFDRYVVASSERKAQEVVKEWLFARGAYTIHILRSDTVIERSMLVEGQI